MIRIRRAKDGTTSYNAVWRDADGRQRSKAFPSRKAAKAHLRPRGGAYEKPPVIVGGQGDVTSNAQTWLPAHKLSDHSRETYGTVLNYHVLQALGGKQLAAVTAADIRTWFRALEAKGCSAALMAKIKTVASAMFQTAAEDGLIPANVVRGITIRHQQRRRRKALTLAQYRQLMEHVPEHYRLLIRTRVETGLRWEETTALTDADIDGQVIHVCNVLQELHKPLRFVLRDSTKNGKARDVKVSPELAKELAAAGPGFLFLRPDGAHISLTTFDRQVWKPALAACGLTGFTPKDLRRTHATWLRLGKASLEDVRDQLGHSSIAVTDRYLDEAKGSQDNVLAALDAVLGDVA